jgi:hypothetical protein
MSEAADLFDVIAVNIKTGAERFMASALTKRNADATVKMAVFRRGVDEEFYSVVPHPHSLAESRPEDEGNPVASPAPVSNESRQHIADLNVIREGRENE